MHPSVFLTNRAQKKGNEGWPRGRLLLALVHNLRSRQPGEPLAALKARVERRYLETVDGVIAVCGRTLAAFARSLPTPCRVSSRSIPGATTSRRASPPSVDDGAARRSLAPAVRGRGEAKQGASPLARCAGAGPPGRVHAGRRGQPGVAALRAADSPPADALRFRGAGAAPRRAHRCRALSLFRQSHILALPSDREAYPLSCLEALGFGLPVLASSSGGTGEMFHHGREGFLLDPHDTGAWAGALRSLADDRGALRAMAGAAVARYRSHATWREAAAATAAFIAGRTPHPNPLPASRGEGTGTSRGEGI